MFNIGLPEMMVLAVVGLIVLGPERLPGLARDAARLLRTLRDAATGARKQLREELGPEFADLNLRDLNPRTAVQRAVFGEEIDLRKFNPKSALEDLVMGEDEPEPAKPVSFDKPASTNGPRPRPRPTPRSYDDIT